MQETYLEENVTSKTRGPNWQAPGQPGDEVHFAFECQGLEYIRQDYPDLLGNPIPACNA